MVKDFIKYQFRNNSICGVYCHTSPDGKRMFRIVVVTNKNGSLEFEILGEVEDNLSEVKEIVKNIPVYLVLDGKGILLRSAVPDPEKTLLKQIIPTAREDEFVADSYAGENCEYVGLARKDQVDEIILQMKNAGLSIISLSLGPYRVVNLARYFNEIPERIIFNNYLFVYNRFKQCISNFEKTNVKANQEYVVDGKKVDPDYLPALSVALEYFLDENKECDHQLVKEHKTEFHSRIIFQKAGAGLLILVLVVLLVNIYFYLHYNDQRQQTENLLAGNRNILTTLDTLKRELEWKEKFMRESGIMKNSKMAFYADRIAASVPEQITLEKLEINPVVGKIRSGKEIVIRPNIILLEGLTRNSLFLNQWIHKLKELDWVEKVAILNYIQDNEKNIGNFSIEVNLKQVMN